MNRVIERHLNILEFTLASLLRRKGRNFSLLAMYLLVIFMLASLLFFVTALKREAAIILSDAPDMIVQQLVAGRQDLVPVAYAGEIARIRGVTAVTPRLWGYYYDAFNGANYTIIADDAAEPDRVSIGSGVARVRNLAVGDLLPLISYDKVPVMLEIGTVFPSASDLIAADLITVSPVGFHHLFNFPAGQATDLAVTVRNPKELSTIASKIASQFPGSRPVLKSEILRTYQSVFNWRGGMTLLLLTSALLSFIIFAWDKATGLSAEERKEIGILKSIGWETSDVLLLKFWEGAVISLTAFLLGTVLAYGHVFFLSAPLFAQALKGWSVIYPRFQLLPVVDVSQLTILFFLTVVPYTTATILPCWRAATIDPDAAMRY
ncbi:MAG: FtsX-like permease family protein [Desulfuromonadaceae bacterium]|nr:FtsX-like permease family protein [Desulfuromonadaceae bacterium]MDD2849880.1 FtsX-like permease family protein [Desulfuromonadaceae bacterium]MDD4130695.1 FtsX-like permease family protein [Desulfuromonadaceae bacterium]